MTDRQTDGQTGGRTDRRTGKKICLPTLKGGDIKRHTGTFFSFNATGFIHLGILKRHNYKGIPKVLLIISVGENEDNKFTQHFFIKTAFAWLTSYKLTNIKRKQLNIYHVNCQQIFNIIRYEYFESL